MRLICSALVFISFSYCPAQSFRLPGGGTDTFSNEWLVETNQRNGEPEVSRVRWRAGNGPEFTFRNIEPGDVNLLEKENRWLPMALADQGVKVHDVQTTGGSNLSQVRRYVCEEGSGRHLFIETAAQQGPAGIFRVSLRYPEGLDAVASDRMNELRMKYLTPSNAVAAPASTPPTNSPGFLQRTYAALTTDAGGEFVRAHSSAMVIISDQDGGGSGFLCRVQSRPMLLTNIHVLAASPSLKFTNLQGQPVRVGRGFVAVGRDVAALEVPEDPGILEMHPTPGDVKVGDEIFVLGNADAAGVVRPIAGRVVGVGPDLVEVDAPFIPGNSGSPIVDKATGKVIGVAAYLTVRTDKFAKGQEEKVVRRFGYRIDGIATWQPVDWKVFFGEQKRLTTIQELTASLAGFIGDLLEDGKVDAGKHQNPAIRNYVQSWDEARRRNPSEANIKQVDGMLLRSLKSTCERDVNEALKTMQYDFFVREVKQDAAYREKMTKYFEKVAAAQR